ncbi:MAG: hypothetical protein RR177_03790 [Oscillospiraceae bacterium]
MAGDLKEKLKGKMGLIIFISGVVGILLLFVSSLLPKTDNTKIAPKADLTAQYIAETEKKLTKIIGDLVNSKNVSVMVTLESGIENIYAGETKKDTGISENKSGDETLKTEQSDKNEQKYIIVKDSNGNETPLLITCVMPRIKGVVVAYEGANDDARSEKIKNAVVTALDISSKKVCVLTK